MANRASEFYMACRNGDLDLVNRYVKTMTVREINRVEESNNSTALHAASFNGHADVVKRLLEVGGNIHTRNGHGLTPVEEAKNPATQDVFRQFPTN